MRGSRILQVFLRTGIILEFHPVPIRRILSLFLNQRRSRLPKFTKIIQLQEMFRFLRLGSEYRLWSRGGAGHFSLDSLHALRYRFRLWGAHPHLGCLHRLISCGPEGLLVLLLLQPQAMKEGTIFMVGMRKT